MKAVYKPLGIVSVIGALVAIWAYDNRWALTALIMVVVAVVLGSAAWMNFIWMRYFGHDDFKRAEHEFRHNQSRF